MFLALHSVDYAVVALLLGVLVAIGIAVGRTRNRTSDFLLADKSLSAMPVGFSLAATLVPAFSGVGSMLVGLSLIGLPGQAYDDGLSPLLIPLAMWLTVPLVWRYILPLYHGLKVTSIYEYLELRFNRRTRTLASIAFLMWRTVWVAGVLALGCQILVAAAGWQIPAWVFVVMLGVVATSYTCLGGIKAVVWAETIQLAVMGAAVTVVLLSIWVALDGGAARMWNVAEALGRHQVLEPAAGGRATSMDWGLVPHAAFALLAFFVADQASMQRLLAVKDVNVARRAFMIGCTALTVAVLLLTGVGLGLLAFYHDHSDSLRAKWIANVDPATRQFLRIGEDERTMLEWDDPSARLNAQNIHALVDQRRLIRPNTHDALDDADALLDETAIEGLQVAQLLTRYPPKPEMRRGEVVLHARANDELLPWYVTTQLPWGLVGLAIAAILAAIMSSVDAGLLALSGIVVMHGRGSAAADGATDMPPRLAPQTTGVVGTIVIIAALWMTQADNFVRALSMVTGTLGGPLLAIFLLGIFTRRTNPAGAMIGLVVGVVLTGWLNGAAPFAHRIDESWSLSIGVLLTMLVGYVASLLAGGRTPVGNLRGLVQGLGRLGERDAEVVPKIKLPTSKRWR